MTNAVLKADQQADVAEVVQRYLDGARSVQSDDMRPAFHENATIFGYVGEDLFVGPIQKAL